MQEEHGSLLQALADHADGGPEVDDGVRVYAAFQAVAPENLQWKVRPGGVWMGGDGSQTCRRWS